MLCFFPQLPYSPLRQKYDYCRKKYSLYIPLLNVLVLLGNVLEGIFFNLCRRKPLDITKGIIQSVLSLLLQSVFVHVCERKRERKRGGEKDGQTSKINGIKYTGEKEAPSFSTSFLLSLGSRGKWRQEIGCCSFISGWPGWPVRSSSP